MPDRYADGKGYGADRITRAFAELSLPQGENARFKTDINSVGCPILRPVTAISPNRIGYVNARRRDLHNDADVARAANIGPASPLTRRDENVVPKIELMKPLRKDSDDAEPARPCVLAGVTKRLSPSDKSLGIHILSADPFRIFDEAHQDPFVGAQFKARPRRTAR
jgi:hypothetical protein